mgnify:CR=1 FL=1|mmetsp:Transcript_9743/g.14525  ORF Transcript_9743/g.14525 Transcript_9743/m.14525 type:complete len:96 (-) Transcript_9743:826-1113(-)
MRSCKDVEKPTPEPLEVPYKFPFVYYLVVLFMGLLSLGLLALGFLKKNWERDFKAGIPFWTAGGCVFLLFAFFTAKLVKHLQKSPNKLYSTLDNL